jgi:hyperosmotically inducible protein
MIMKLLNPFPVACIAAVLLGLCACSDNGSADKVGQKIDKAAGTAKEKLAESSDALRRDAEKADATLNDVALAAKVKAEIRKDSMLKMSDISVDSHSGTVVLSGTVDKPEDALRAVQIAQQVEDVKSVENKLSVRSSS